MVRGAAALLLLLGMTIETVAVDECGQYTTCAECLPNDYCGWCSPGNVIFKDGTPGKRCGDIRNTDGPHGPWDCPGKYQTVVCEDGYTCDPANFTCVHAGKGEGSPKEVCEASCKKPAKVFACNRTTYTCEEAPPGSPNDGSQEVCSANCQVQYVCNTTTYTCEETDAPGAAGLPKEQCDASCKKPDPLYKCEDVGIAGNLSCVEASAAEGGIPKDVCDEQCVSKPPTPETPAFLRGLWRGVQINKGYVQGEWDFDFGESSVTVTQPDKQKWKADVLQSTDPGNPADGIRAQVWLAFSSGPASGKIMKGKFDETTSGGDAPETQNVFLGFGRPDLAAAATAPDTPDAAMAGAGMTAYVLSKCKPGLPNCKFVPQSWAALSSQLEQQHQQLPQIVGVQETESGGQRRLEGVDRCNTHPTCQVCITDPSCGWCSVPVIYADGSASAQCAGYDAAGKADPPWTCPAMYQLNDCGDYLCDQETFQCREAGPGELGTLTKEECDSTCKPVDNKVYLCNQEDFTCEVMPDGTPGATSGEVCEEQCKKPPPLKKCNTETKTCEEGCKRGDEGCIEGAVCDEQCKHEPPTPPTPTPTPTPPTPTPPTPTPTPTPPTPPPVDPITPTSIRGIWRGIGIQNGYHFGEWDVEIGESAAVFKNAQSQVWHANITTGGGVPMTITPSDGPHAGKAIKCLYTQQTGPEVTRMTLAMGLPGADGPPADYDSAMTPEVGLAELFLSKCKDAAGSDPAGIPLCDFSKSAPH